MWQLYWSKFFQVIFCYYSCTWTAQLIRGVFHYSYSCYFSAIIGPSLSFWSLISFCQGCWKIRGIWIRSLYGCRSWWRRRQRVRKYDRGWHIDILGDHHIIHIYIRTIWNTHTHTQWHVYIPWLHKSVIKKVGCGTSHKYTKCTNLQCKY